MQELTKKYDHFASCVRRSLALAGIICILQFGVASSRPLYDFTGDVRTDFTNIVATTTGAPMTWKTLRNPGIPGPGNAFIRSFNWGVVGDSITPGDYFGDGKTEIAVWRAGVFHETPFPETIVGPVTYEYWGNPTGENLGRTGDYDGDGKDDETTVRLSGGLLTWIYKGSTSGYREVRFGQSVAGRSTLAFMGADFTGDGRDEIVFCTASTSTGANTWWIGDSVTGSLVLTLSWGNFITDYFVQPADYTGDGIADIVVYRGGAALANGGGTWWIRNTATGGLVPVRQWGIPDPTFLTNDAPLRGDYDGDGISDIAVWRPSTAEYWWINSSNGAVGYQQWGDTVLTADFTEFPLGTLFSF